MAAGRIMDGVLAAGALPTLGEIGLSRFAPYLINRIAQHWNGDLADRLRGFGLTTAMMRVLAVLSLNSGLTTNELAVLTVAEQSTMSRTLDAMEELGLIRRRQREADLRVREIHITDPGRATFDRFWPTMFESYARLFDGISEAEHQAFLLTLHKLLRNQLASEA